MPLRLRKCVCGLCAHCRRLVHRAKQRRTEYDSRSVIDAQSEEFAMRQAAFPIAESVQELEKHFPHLRF